MKKNSKAKGNVVNDKPVPKNIGIKTLQEDDTLKPNHGEAFSIDFLKTETSYEILERSFNQACLSQKKKRSKKFSTLGSTGI